VLLYPYNSDSVIIFYPQESVSVHDCAYIIEHAWYYNGLLLYFFEKQHVTSALSLCYIYGFQVNSKFQPVEIFCNL
jgi:hypothetical protein